MRTPVCELLGVDVPIVAFSHCRDVVIEVSRAGGFGVFGATVYTPEQLDVELRCIEDALDGRPYGVDVLIPVRYEGRAEGGLSRAQLRDRIPDAYREFVDELLSRYAVPPLLPDHAAERRRRDIAPGASEDDGSKSLLDVVFAHDITLFASALGPPPADVVARAHDHDVLVAALAGTPAHAVRHAAAAVDIVVAQGSEAGGHTGEIGTMVLVPDVVDAVAPLPVLAAGGIADGRQMAAAFALGAQGVWTGSVWLTTEEAETHPTVKQKFLAAQASDTVRSRSLTGKPARQLRSAWTDAWDAPDAPPPLPMPLQSLLVADAQHRIGRAARDPESGAAQLVNYFVGQVVGRTNEVKPARQVVFDMVSEFIDAVDALGAQLAVDDEP
jgi:NAD(P)H-dependent flavin oxidoreductase YrpB (nitropropane dioxygenase family)